MDSQFSNSRGKKNQTLNFLNLDEKVLGHRPNINH